MISEGKFGVAEATSLVALFVLGKIFLTYQAPIIEGAGQAAWMAMLLASLIGLGAFIVVILLMEQYPGQSIIDVGEELVGPVVNTLFSLVYLSFFIALSALSLRQFSERVVALFVGEMPISMAVLPFLAGMLAVAYLGLETLARGARIFIWIIIPGFLLVLVLTYPFWEWFYLLPIFGLGLDRVALTGLRGSGFFAELFILALIYPALPRDKFRQIGLGSWAISALVLVLGITGLSLAFAYPMAIELSQPTFEMARLIYFGRFIQRLETVFAVVWLLGGLVKLSLGLYLCSTIGARMLRLPYSRPLLPALAVIIVSLAFAPESVARAVQLDNEYLRALAWGLLGPVLVLLAITHFKGKGKKPPGKEGQDANQNNSPGGGPVP